MKKQKVDVFLCGMMAVFFALTCPYSSTAGGFPPPPPQIVPGTFVEGELLVKFKSEVTKARINQLISRLGSEKLQDLSDGDVLLLKIPTITKEMADAITLYKSEPDVEYAEPNHIFYFQVLPSENTYGRFSELWGLTKINAPNAWNFTTGNNSIVVATIDSGLYYGHEDLVANSFKNNPLYLYGCNAAVHDRLNPDGTVNFAYYDPWDTSYGHGTHVAGIIGAVGNNDYGVGKDVVGVNWQVDIIK